MGVYAGPRFSLIEASGGTITEVVVGRIVYKVHTFTDVGTTTFGFSFTKVLPYVNYLIVAGGGSGGNFNGGGGGAGGLLQGTIRLNSNNYSITVGAGGTSTFYNDSSMPGRSGLNSSAIGLTAIGGGSGGSRAGGGALSGGSGGGGSGYGSPPGGSGTLGQGNNGSQGSIPGSDGGGGGGAGAAAYGGGGGIGIYSTISGIGTYYAGGGGGSYGGIGGLGGGATGNNSSSATPNTGGGGGGQWGVSYTGNGGSGIVIIRYPVRPA